MTNRCVSCYVTAKAAKIGCMTFCGLLALTLLGLTIAGLVIILTNPDCGYKHSVDGQVGVEQRRRSDLKSGGTEKFRLAPSALAKFCILNRIQGHRQKIFQRGAKPLTPLIIGHCFCAPKIQTTICAFLRRLRPN